MLAARMSTTCVDYTPAAPPYQHIAEAEVFTSIPRRNKAGREEKEPR